MADDINSTAEKSAVKRKTPQGRPFTSESSKAVQKKAAEMRKLRKEMRRRMLETVSKEGLEHRRMLETVSKEGLEHYMAKAIKTGDEKLMNIVVAASKLTGVDFTSSEDAVQRVDAKVDAKTQGKLEVVVKGLDG